MLQAVNAYIDSTTGYNLPAESTCPFSPKDRLYQGFVYTVKSSDGDGATRSAANNKRAEPGPMSAPVSKCNFSGTASQNH